MFPIVKGTLPPDPRLYSGLHMCVHVFRQTHTHMSHQGPRVDMKPELQRRPGNPEPKPIPLP